MQLLKHLSDNHFLLNSGSFTDWSRKRGISYDLRVLTQRWGFPQTWEQNALKQREKRYIWVREVIACQEEQIIFFARTILPQRTLLHPKIRVIKKLNQNPLGDVLFKQPRLMVERSPFKFNTLQHIPGLSQRIHQLKLPISPQDIVRYSIFRIAGLPLLLSEVFPNDFVVRCND